MSERSETATPPEQLLYETLKQKSHFPALSDHLRFLIQPESRIEYESYISQLAGQTGHKTLTLSNLKQMPNWSVANLYWYFKLRDNLEDEREIETVDV